MNGASRTSDGSTNKLTEILPNAELTMQIGAALKRAGPKDSVVAEWYGRHPSDFSREVRGVRPGPVTRTVWFIRRLAYERNGNERSVLDLMIQAATDVAATDLSPVELGQRFHALRAAKAEADAAEMRMVAGLAATIMKQPETREQVRNLLALLGGYPAHLIAIREATTGLLIYTQALLRAYGRQGDGR